MTAPTTPFVAPAALIMSRCADNAYYRRAVQTRDYLQAVELREVAIKRRGAVPAVASVPMPPSADVDLTGWLELVGYMAEAERVRTVQIAALDQLIATCERRIESAAARPDAILQPLAGDMAAVMAKVGEAVARLDGCHTAGEVVASGDSEKLAAFGEIRTLRSEYDQIRQAQEWALQGQHLAQISRSEYLDDALADDAAVANLDEIFPAWKRPAPDIALMRWDQPDPRPWPKDRTEQLIWCVTSGAQVWVPTLEELRELHNRRRLARSHPNGKPKPSKSSATQVLNEPPTAPARPTPNSMRARTPALAEKGQP